MIQKSYEAKSCLYLIPTPIGNFEDITIRALNILAEVNYLLCEDTRVTKFLLDHFNIKQKLISCHEYNEEKIKEKVWKDIEKGLTVGLVTDQGSPIISDPGFKVVSFLAQKGINVVALPGATAVIPALMTSGIDSSHFLFYGFLNSKSSKRIQELEVLKKNRNTIVFYESVHRISETLKNIYEIFGDREICLCRELSKIHEEIFRGKLSEILKGNLILKGEFVIVVEGNKEQSNFSDISIEKHVKMYIDEGISVNDSIKLVAKDRNMKKSDVYREYHIGK